MKNLVKFLVSIAIMLVAIYYIHDYYINQKNTIETINIGANGEYISSLKEKYNNNEIVMFIEIPNVFALPIPQTDDNNYYYSHDIKRIESNNGSAFLDYRNRSLSDKKLIIYGHNNIYRSLPFNNVLNYQSKDFFNKHKTIYVYTDDGKKAYDIFTVANIENETDYLDLNHFNNIEFYEHLLKYKDKSLYDTGVTIDGESKVIVIVNHADTADDNKKLVIMAIENKQI